LAVVGIASHDQITNYKFETTNSQSPNSRLNRRLPPRYYL